MTTTTHHEDTESVGTDDSSTRTPGETDTASRDPGAVDRSPNMRPGADTALETPSRDQTAGSAEEPNRNRRRRGPRRRAMAAGEAWIVMVIALTVGLLLNAEAIEHTAETQPVGLGRSVAVALAQPVAGLSRTLRLHLPRVWIAGAVDRADAGGNSSGDIRTGRAAGGEAGRVADDEIGRSADPEKSLAWAGSNVVWIGGDSLMGEPGPVLARALDEADGVEWATFTKPATGLVRPDAFDWFAKMEAEMAAYNPRLVVMALGANDAQGIPAGTLDDSDLGDFTFGSDGWRGEYARRVGAMMELVGSGGRPVVWLGHPITSSSRHNEKIGIINEIYRAGAEPRDNVTYVDTWGLFTDADGEYADYLPGADGRQELMRAPDGIHYSAAGARRLSDELLPLVLEQFSGDGAIGQDAPANVTE